MTVKSFPSPFSFFIAINTSNVPVLGVTIHTPAPPPSSPGGGSLPSCSPLAPGQGRRGGSGAFLQLSGECSGRSGFPSFI